MKSNITVESQRRGPLVATLLVGPVGTGGLPLALDSRPKLNFIYGI
jgi:hypothetical protein